MKQRKELVYNNWKRLYKGVLIRDQLEAEHGKVRSEDPFPLGKAKEEKEVSKKENKEKKPRVKKEAKEAKEKPETVEVVEKAESAKPSKSSSAKSTPKAKVEKKIEKVDANGRHVHEFETVKENKDGTVTRQCACGLTLTSENLLL
jgi:hypothetical protein